MIGLLRMAARALPRSAAVSAVEVSTLEAAAVCGEAAVEAAAGAPTLR